MSDTPLFQKVDELEAAIAAERPAGVTTEQASATPIGVTEEEAATGAEVVPTTAGAFSIADTAPGLSTAPGIASEVSPVVGAAALAQETQQQHSDDRVS